MVGIDDDDSGPWDISPYGGGGDKHIDEQDEQMNNDLVSLEGCTI